MQHTFLIIRLITGTQNASDIIDPVAAINPLLGVIVALLIAAIGYLVVEGRRKDKTILDLNADFRQMSRDDITTLNTLGNTLSTLKDGSKETISGLKEIRDKLTELISRIPKQ